MNSRVLIADVIERQSMITGDIDHWW